MQLYSKLGLRKKNMHRVLELNQCQRITQYVEFKTQKEWKQKKWWQRWKSVEQINKKCGIWKTIENLRCRIDLKFVSNKRDYLKLTSKPSYIFQKIFDNDLVAIRKNKVKLTLNKPAYIRMCILELSIDVWTPL